MTTTPTQQWTRALEQLEDQLLEHLDYLASEDDSRESPPPFAPPRGMPPLPEELRPRAEQLVETIRTVTSELEVEHARIVSEMQKLRRSPRMSASASAASSPSSESFDARA